MNELSLSLNTQRNIPLIAHRKYRLTQSNTTDNTKRQFVLIDLSLTISSQISLCLSLSNYTFATSQFIAEKHVAPGQTHAFARQPQTLANTRLPADRCIDHTTADGKQISRLDNTSQTKDRQADNLDRHLTSQRPKQLLTAPILTPD